MCARTLPCTMEMLMMLMYDERNSPRAAAACCCKKNRKIGRIPSYSVPKVGTVYCLYLTTAAILLCTTVLLVRCTNKHRALE